MRLKSIGARMLWLLALASLSSGCISVSAAQYASASAGSIGCPSSEIRISGQPSRLGIGSPQPEWRAECRGRKFICGGAGKTIACSPELQPEEPARPDSAPAVPASRANP